ncbi:MAG: hypothetical protein FK732_12075 [Asgard group archaeon]|nr:hypothetical protein [Asgard group archaeon]
MTPEDSIRIIDITENESYSIYLQRCFVGPCRKYRRREAYFIQAIPKGFKKKLLFFNNDRVGTIEHAPPEASYYPIQGKDILVLNCIWILRRAKGHGLGKILFDDMLRNNPKIAGVATIAIEGHWSDWFLKKHFEKYGFSSIDSIKVANKRKHQDVPFSIHLMWLSLRENSPQPTWNKKKLLEGITYCLFHPLYNPISYEEKYLLKKVDEK